MSTAGRAVTAAAAGAADADAAAAQEHRRRRGRPRWAPWLGVLALCGVVAAVWADVAAGGALARADVPLLAAVREARTPAATVVARVVTELGGGWGRCALGALVAGAAASRTRRWEPVVATAAVLAVAPLLNHALKALTGRARPPLGEALIAAEGLSFPSGHAMGSAAVAVVLAWVVVRSGAPSQRRVLVVAAVGGAYALAVGSTRVYLGVHWPSDVVGGWAAGAAVGWAVVLVARRPRGARGGAHRGHDEQR